MYGEIDKQEEMLAQEYGRDQLSSKKEIKLTCREKLAQMNGKMI